MFKKLRKWLERRKRQRALPFKPIPVIPPLHEFGVLKVNRRHHVIDTPSAGTFDAGVEEVEYARASQEH
jgi:hypothetical protein